MVGTSLCPHCRDRDEQEPTDDVLSRPPDAPWHHPRMETIFGAWHGTSTSLDAEGTSIGGEPPAGEGRSLRRSKFAGSRAGALIDDRSFRYVARHWGDAMDQVAVVREAFERFHGLPDERLSATYAFVLATTLSSLPALLLRRADEPMLCGEIPPFVATAAGAGKGLATAVEAVLLGGDAARLQKPIWPDALLGRVEADRLLIGPRAVCPVTSERLLEFIEVAIEGRGCTPQPSLTPIPAMFSLERALRYGATAARMELCRMLLLGLCARRLRALRSLPEDAARQVPGLPEFLLASAPSNPRVVADDRFAERMVRGPATALTLLELQSVVSVLESQPTDEQVGDVQQVLSRSGAPDALVALTAQSLAGLRSGLQLAMVIFARFQEQSQSALGVGGSVAPQVDDPLRSHGLAIGEALHTCFGLRVAGL